MPSDSTGKKNKHKNKERTVKCPVEGCEEEVLARGLHLHIIKKDGDGHGTQDEKPPDIDLDDAETVGEREVEMEYPEERESEQVARLCPYCKQPFNGKEGLMIHLGATTDRNIHPENATEIHDPEDFPIVHIDEDDNVVEVVEEGATMPSTDKRREKEANGEPFGPDDVREQIESLREQGLEDQAEQLERALLRD